MTCDTASLLVPPARSKAELRVIAADGGGGDCE